MNSSYMRIFLALAILVAVTGGCKKTTDKSGTAAAKPPAQSTTQPESSPADGNATSPVATTTASPSVPVTGLAMDAAAYHADLAAITKNTHRLTGYADGSIAASHYVESRLRASGFDDSDLTIQEFPVVQAVATECRLTVNGKKIEGTGGLNAIYACRPNLLQASVTPVEGLSGQAIYVGKGTVAEFGTILPHNKIVVMEFDCNKNWLTAFAFGARAVVFVGSDDEVASSVQQHIVLPANLPRFYVSRATAKAAGLLDNSQTRQVTIHAASTWTRLRGRNVIAHISGTAPVFSGDKTGLPQMIVLAAPLDTLSEVPELAPGARDAANVASLIQIAKHLRLNPPRRDVLICFFDGQAQRHSGARAFYGSINRGKRGVAPGTKTLDDLLAYYKAEEAFLQKVVNFLKNENVFAAEARQSIPSDMYRQTLQILRSETMNLGGDALDELRAARLKREDMKRYRNKLEKSPDNATDSVKAEIEELTNQIDAIEPDVAYFEDVEMEWNSVQRDIHDEKLTDETRHRFKQLQSHSHRIYSQRIDELRQAIKDMEVAIKLRSSFGPERKNTVLHISLNLGDERERWTFIHGDHSDHTIENDGAGNYMQVFKSMQMVNQSLQGQLRLLDDGAIKQEYETTLFAPGTFADSGSAARLFAIYNVSIMTVLDHLPRQGQPADTLGMLRSERIFTQAREAGLFIRNLGDESDYLPRPSTMAPTAAFVDAEWLSGSNRSTGMTVRQVGGGSAMRLRPVRQAVVAVFARTWAGNVWVNFARKVPPGFERALIAQSNVNGVLEFGPYSKTLFTSNTVVLPATFDEKLNDDGTVSSRGLINGVGSQQTWMVPTLNSSQPVVLFKATPKAFVGFGFDRGNILTKAMQDASTASFRLDRSLICENENVLAMFAPRESKGFKIFSKTGWVLLNNNALDYGGAGYLLDDPFEHPPTALVTASDLRILNDYRLDLLTRNRINQDSLQEINQNAKQVATDAIDASRTFTPTSGPALATAAAVPTQSTSRYFGDLEASAALSRRVYVPLIGVMNDLVTAVVLLLLMAIPFAFALERLLIGTPYIYRQIGWFGVFFVTTFAVLFFVNPAFRIAATPIIIFLAFAIILLSSLVIFIMIRKLQSEMKKMQGLSSTVHSTDVSRLSTMMAAVSMGISTMRRRPLRTLLTSATVVLLTFTILTFASFGSTWGARRTHIGAMSGSTPRIIVRHQIWSPLVPGTYESLRGHFAQKASVIPRYWVAPTATEAAQTGSSSSVLDLLLTDESTFTRTNVSAAIGLSFDEIKLLRPPSSAANPNPKSDIEQIINGDVSLLQKDGILMTGATADALELKPQDVGKKKVLLAGRTFTFAGTFKDDLANYNILEGSSILPVDYAASAGAGIGEFAAQESGQSLAELPDQPNAQFVPFSVDKAVIIGADAAVHMGALLRYITIIPNDPLDLKDVSERAAAITELPTYAGDANGVYRLLFTSLTEASGVKDLMIPVLLGGLIVFATMLGSVSDREREIYTFSSLGLAPPHVASLFFAEASMYAIIGGMGGYLMGQVVARLLNWMSTFLDFTVPSMNYSSTNAIVTVLIVMCTVLISTIYPAVKASRSANPGIQRAWKIPSPQNDLYDLVFPFTVSAYDIIGVVSFLKEHFDNYSDTSLGVFATAKSRIFRQKDNDMLAFSAEVALAPFDLGVNQAFAMLSKPSDIEGINEVRILIHRLTGADGDWKRGNRIFVNDLRKQLLIWRSLPHEVMDHYRQQTLEQWDRLQVEQVDETTIGAAL